METLDFTLPSETRTVWKNEAIREVWNYRIDKINGMIQDIQYLSVKEGKRKAGREMMRYKDFVKSAQKSFKDNVLFIPLRNVEVNHNYNLSISNKKKTGVNCLYLNRKDLPENFNIESVANSNKKMGKLLGYPECCINFFSDEWENADNRDMIWQSALNTKSATREGNKITIENSPKVNTILKAMGIRAVLHMPHSFDCEESAEIHDYLMEVAIKYGYRKEVRWLKKLLSMEMKWSSLHGIAIITTPILKLRMTTDPVPEELIVEHEGHDNFMDIDKNFWRDNGFTDYKSMEMLHEPLEQLSEKHGKFESFVDMGCGNGYLLSKIDADKKIGYELFSRKVKNANKLFDLDIRRRNIFNLELEFNPEAIHISANRIKEAEEQGKLEHIKQQLSKADNLYITSYDDGLEDYNGVIKFLESRGIEVIRTISMKIGVTCVAKIK